MKVYLYIVLFVLVLLAPFALRGVVGRAGSREEAPAGAFRLVVITPNNQDIRQEFAWAFERWYREHYQRDVTIDYRTPGGANDIRRQLELTYRAARDAQGRIDPGYSPDYDIAWGGGDYFFDQELKPLGLLQGLGLSEQTLKEAFPQPTLAGIRLYDAGKGEPKWAGVALSSFGIVYNPDLYDTLKMTPPRTWTDLADERLHDLVALADPTHSGSVAVAYMMVVQRAMADAEGAYLAKHAGEEKAKLAKDPAYHEALAAGWKRGMGTLVLMAANARYFTASAPIVPTDVAAGDAAAGVAIDFYARVYEETAGPRRVRFVMPAGATAITPDPVAILAGVRGERLEVARRFVEFLLTREAQRLWALKAGEAGGPRERALRRLPVRRDVYADRAGWSDDVDPFAEAQGFNERLEWMGLFGEMRNLWRSGWIDSRDELKAAYAEVLRVEDAGRRKRLLAELADVPVELKDVEAIHAERRKLASGAGDVDEWRARQQIEWGNKFRAHYAAVEAEAAQAVAEAAAEREAAK